MPMKLALFTAVVLVASTLPAWADMTCRPDGLWGFNCEEVPRPFSHIPSAEEGVRDAERRWEEFRREEELRHARDEQTREIQRMMEKHRREQQQQMEELQQSIQSNGFRRNGYGW